MITFSFIEFIKKEYLTEAGLSIVNNLWSEIDNYIKEPELWYKNLLASAKWSDRASDFTLDSLITKHFTAELSALGLTVEACELGLYKTNEVEQEFGSCVFNLMNTSNTLKNTKQVKVQLAIQVCRISELTPHKLMSVLYHELIHAEQAIKIIKHMGMDKVISKLPPFKWVPSAILTNSHYEQARTEVEYVNDPEEIEAYGRDLAIQIFYKYKQHFKTININQQDYFIRNTIIPNIKNEMSVEMRTKFLDNLVDDKIRHRFFIFLIKQLEEFATAVAHV